MRLEECSHADCPEEHIYEDVDLVLIELGINDLNHIDVIAKYEHLVRSVLELDSSPAMINVEWVTRNSIGETHTQNIYAPLSRAHLELGPARRRLGIL